MVALCEGLTPRAQPIPCGLTQGKLGIASHSWRQELSCAGFWAEVTRKHQLDWTPEISVNPIVSPPKRTHTSKAETQSFVKAERKVELTHEFQIQHSDP